MNQGKFDDHTIIGGVSSEYAADMIHEISTLRSSLVNRYKEVIAFSSLIEDSRVYQGVLEELFVESGTALEALKLRVGGGGIAYLTTSDFLKVLELQNKLKAYMESVSQKCSKAAEETRRKSTQWYTFLQEYDKKIKERRELERILENCSAGTEKKRGGLGGCINDDWIPYGGRIEYCSQCGARKILEEGEYLSCDECGYFEKIPGGIDYSLDTDLLEESILISNMTQENYDAVFYFIGGTHDFDSGNKEMLETVRDLVLLKASSPSISPFIPKCSRKEMFSTLYKYEKGAVSPVAIQERVWRREAAEREARQRGMTYVPDAGQFTYYVSRMGNAKKTDKETRAMLNAYAQNEEMVRKGHISFWIFSTTVFMILLIGACAGEWSATAATFFGYAYVAIVFLWSKTKGKA